MKNILSFLATNYLYYNSQEAVDFTNIFFYVMAYHAFKASNRLAEKFGPFKESKFADGSYFEKYTNCEKDKWVVQTEKVKSLFLKYNVDISTQEQWKELADKIKKTK